MKYKVKYQGCDEDCLNCRYPDCYKPAQHLKSISDVAPQHVESKGKSQARMYTVELGHINTNSPNIRKKRYL